MTEQTPTLATLAHRAGVPTYRMGMFLTMLTLPFVSLVAAALA